MKTVSICHTPLNLSKMRRELRERVAAILAALPPARFPNAGLSGLGGFWRAQSPDWFVCQIENRFAFAVEEEYREFVRGPVGPIRDLVESDLGYLCNWSGEDCE
jgi:hypothetical protein